MAKIADILASGVGGVLPVLAAQEYKRQAIKDAAALAAAKAASVGNVGGVGTTGAVAKPMKKGGSASSRADGCAVRGKTKGKMY